MPPSLTDASWVGIGDSFKQDASGALKTAVELLSIAASMTQSVPYLGIVSNVLTEIVKMEDVSHRASLTGVLGLIMV